MYKGEQEDTAGDSTETKLNLDNISQPPSNPFFGRAPKNDSGPNGEVYFEFTPYNIVRSVVEFFTDELSRTRHADFTYRTSSLHNRPPDWMENKNVSIDGSPLSDEELKLPTYWQTKYSKEMDIAAAVLEVRRKKRTEATHDVIGAAQWLKRSMGFAPPLNESIAAAQVEARYERLEKMKQLEEAEKREDEAARRAENARGAAETVVAPSTKIGVLVESPRRDAAGSSSSSTAPVAWAALMASVQTGKPIAKVAREYRPRVAFYGLDAFLDSAPSFIWFSTKCGIAIGLVQGTIKAIQAINVDVQFLQASGVGVLSVLNMSVFASVVKWAGNTAAFATAFCIGDRLTTAVKYRIMPAHDARQRGVINYVVGIACAGGTVGIMPWWVLSDVNLALRMAASGMFVGGILGLGTGLVLNRLISLNVSRLDATNRQLRRYEALMLREKEWARSEVDKYKSTEKVWW